MRKRRQLAAGLRLVLLAVWAACPVHAYEALQGPTELLYWDKTSTLTYFTDTDAARLTQPQGFYRVIQFP